MLSGLRSRVRGFRFAGFGLGGFEFTMKRLQQQWVWGGLFLDQLKLADVIWSLNSGLVPSGHPRLRCTEMTWHRISLSTPEKFAPSLEQACEIAAVCTFIGRLYVITKTAPLIAHVLRQRAEPMRDHRAQHARV